MGPGRLVFLPGVPTGRFHTLNAASPPPPRPGPDLPSPSDLAAGEADMAALFQELEASPPRALGGRVLESFDPAPRSRFRVPRGRFFLVAVLLLALAGGAVAWVSLAARDAEVDARARRNARGREDAHHAAGAVVLDDPRVPLYRGLEDFRSLDVGRPDEDELAASCPEAGVR